MDLNKVFDVYKNIFIIVAVGAILITLALSNKLPLKLGGYTTLSLTKATFQSTNPFFNGPAWILTVAQGGMGQYAYGYIDKDEVGEMSGKYPEHDLEIHITYGKFDWEYPINTFSGLDPIYHYTVKTWFCLFPPSKQDAIDHCGSNARWYGKFPFSYTCFCVARTTVATVASIDNCQFHTKSTIEVKAKGETYNSDIDSKGKVSTFVGPYVYVEWNGNLVKQQCPDLSSTYVAFYKDKWKVGYKSYYEQYRNKMIYLENRLNSEENIDENTLKNLVDDTNYYASLFLSNEAHPYDDIDTTMKTPYIIVHADDAQVPVYTFYVKADWLGIYQPSPKPEILYAKGDEFGAGETGHLYVEVQNVGDEAGTINVWAECEYPIQVLDTTKTLYLEPNERGSVTIRVTANVGEDITKECTIYAQALDETDSTSVKVTVHRYFECSEGDRICMDNDIYICQDGRWVPYMSCGPGEYCGYRYGEPQCIGEESPSDPIDDVEDDVGRATNNLIEWLKNNWIAVLMVIALFVILFYPTKKKSIKTSK